MNLARQIKRHGIGTKPLPKVKREKLVATAIKRDIHTYEGGTLGHWAIRNRLGDEDPQQRQAGDTDGFITSTGRFVDRAEAKEIALESGQLRGPMQRELLSSDLDW